MVGEGVHGLAGFAADGDDFEYTYEGQTLTYTIISEADKTVKTKEGTYSTSSSGNSVSGDLILPEKVRYNGSEYTLTIIGYYAFHNCSGLTSVTIPNSVTSIGSSAFSGCTGLTKVEIPNSVTSIGYDAFGNCTGLTKVEISDLSTWCAIKFGTGSANPLSYAKHLYLNDEEVINLVIPESVTSIGSYAFYGCTGLTSVTIPNSVTSIGGEAFSDCTRLTSVEIGNSVTSIGREAFSGCRSLTSVEIPNSVTGIGRQAFAYCTGLTKVEIPNSVTTIGNEAFYYCTGLTKVEIPNSVTDIGKKAFSGCSSLTSVTIGNGVTLIYSEAFINCNSLNNVYFNAKNCSLHYVDDNNNALLTFPTTVSNFVFGDEVTKIPAGVLMENIRIRSINIPESVTEIGDYAFAWTEALREIVIPNSVKTIGIGAFYNSKKLAAVQLGASVTKIDGYAFNGCTGLTSVTIPSSVTMIGAQAFLNCTNLEEVAIGCGIKEIGSQAFGSDVENVYITASEPADAFDNSFANYNANLWLTPGCAINYKYATYCWWQFSDSKELVVPTNFTTSRSEVTAETGKQVRVGAIFTPEDVTLPYVYWYSTNRDAATIEQNGLITIIDDSKGCDIVAVNLYETNNMAVIKVNGGQVGVEDIPADSLAPASRPNDIYNLQGMLLKRNASQEDVDALAPGLYIIGGKKVLVK